MRLHLSILLLFVLAIAEISAQNVEIDCQIESIEKKIGDLQSNLNLENPVNSYALFNYYIADGDIGKLRDISSYKIKFSVPNPSVAKVPVSDEKKKKILGRTIKEVIIYKDSIAGVITDFKSLTDSACIFSFQLFENGIWVNAGEGMSMSIDEARKSVKSQLPELLMSLRRINRLQTSVADTLSFMNFINQNGISPKEYLLQKLATNKLVISGEVHRRSASWDLMRDLIKDPLFAQNVGTIFMELPSNKQADIDSFFQKNKKDKEILLNIFRAEQIYGWWDGDEYDFLLDLYDLNTKLPKNKKIKVVLTDFQPSWDSIHTPEDYKHYPEEDRNTHMAQIISKSIDNSEDTRNGLFIVGLLHAYKSNVMRNETSNATANLQMTAGAQLSMKYPNEVFTVFQHSLAGDNSGQMRAKLRNGFFDYIFQQYNNKPMAFDLLDSPFGKEIYDAAYEISCNEMTGDFEDNFDGYIFFGALAEEEKGRILSEIFTDDYVIEMKRRAKLCEYDDREIWYGVNPNNLTKESIISYLENKKKNNPKYCDL